MKLYSNKMIEFYDAKINKAKKVSLYPLFVVIPLFILCIIFTKLATKNLFIFLGTLVLSIFTCNFTYNLIENIIKSKDLIKHIDFVLKGNRQEINGNIISISPKLTLKRNIHIIEIEIKEKNKTYKVYLNIDLFGNKFNVNDNVKVKISNNFICEYED